MRWFTPQRYFGRLRTLRRSISSPQVASDFACSVASLREFPDFDSQAATIYMMEAQQTTSLNAGGPFTCRVKWCWIPGKSPPNNQECIPTTSWRLHRHRKHKRTKAAFSLQRPNTRAKPLQVSLLLRDTGLAHCHATHAAEITRRPHYVQAYRNARTST